MSKGILLLLVLTLLFNAPADYQFTVSSNPAAPNEYLDKTQALNFKQHGLEIIPSDESFNIQEDRALSIALDYVGKEVCQTAQAIKTVKGRFTDHETPVLPGENIVLNNYPVWIVTFHNVTLYKHGGPCQDPDRDNTVKADDNVVIDAGSGEVLMSIAYSI